ncbi:MAG: HAD hydrolase-like protein [Elusimicrobiota bacterium]
MKKVILFDIDGTIIKAGGAGLRALNKAILEMGGPSDICSHFELQGSTDRVNFQNAFYSAFKRMPTQKEFRKLSKLYIKYLPEEVEYSVKKKIYFKINGIEKFLDFLSKQDDILIGLGTGNLKEGAYIKLKPSGLSHYFLFGGFGENHTKREDMLKKAVKNASKILKSKIRPFDVYVIGDTEKDITAAKNLGYHSACVLDGFGDKRKIFMAGPELIEKDFSNIDIWLIWLGLKKDPKGVKRGSYICPDTPIEHAYYGMTGIGSWNDLNEMLEDFSKKKGR